MFQKRLLTLLCPIIIKSPCFLMTLVVESKIMSHKIVHPPNFRNVPAKNCRSFLDTKDLLMLWSHDLGMLSLVKRLGAIKRRGWTECKVNLLSQYLQGGLDSSLHTISCFRRHVDLFIPSLRLQGSNSAFGGGASLCRMLQSWNHSILERIHRS
jgi:hypothetical protein